MLDLNGSIKLRFKEESDNGFHVEVVLKVGKKPTLMRQLGLSMISTTYEYLGLSLWDKAVRNWTSSLCDGKNVTISFSIVYKGKTGSNFEDFLTRFKLLNSGDEADYKVRVSTGHDNFEDISVHCEHSSSEVASFRDLVESSTFGQ